MLILIHSFTVSGFLWGVLGLLLGLLVLFITLSPGLSFLAMGILWIIVGRKRKNADGTIVKAPRAFFMPCLRPSTRGRRTGPRCSPRRPAPRGRRRSAPTCRRRAESTGPRSSVRPRPRSRARPPLARCARSGSDARRSRRASRGRGALPRCAARSWCSRWRLIHHPERC